jgi:hypothetical protein
MHGSHDGENEYEADEVEIIANLRVEQRIAGAVPFSKNYKQISITFCPEGDVPLSQRTRLKPP